MAHSNNLAKKFVNLNKVKRICKILYKKWKNNAHKKLSRWNKSWTYHKKRLINKNNHLLDKRIIY
jgi:hypothetical protein